MSRTSDPLCRHWLPPPGYDLAVEDVDIEGKPNDLAIPAGKLQAIRAPAQVRAHDHDLTIPSMAYCRMFLQNKGIGRNDPVLELATDG